MTLTDDLDMINVHHHTKFDDPNPNGSKDNDYIPNQFNEECLFINHAIPFHGCFDERH